MTKKFEAFVMMVTDDDVDADDDDNLGGHGDGDGGDGDGDQDNSENLLQKLIQGHPHFVLLTM